jgi:hypothetical protein
MFGQLLLDPAVELDESDDEPDDDEPDDEEPEDPDVPSGAVTPSGKDGAWPLVLLPVCPLLPDGAPGAEPSWLVPVVVPPPSW